MDAARFKRREETHTNRHVVNDSFSGVLSPETPVQRAIITPPPRRVLAEQKHAVIPQVPVAEAAPEIAARRIQVHHDVPAEPAAYAAAPVVEAVPIAQIPVADEVAPSQPRKNPLDLELPGGMSPAKIAGISLRLTRLPVFKRWALRGSIALVIIVIGTGGLLFSQGYFKAKKVFKGNAKTAASLTANVDPTLLKGEGDGRVNILLLGRGGGSHEAPDLTDTIMLMSVDPINKTTSLLSIPRDLWVNVPTSGAMKLNAAYETGKFKQLGKVNPNSNDPKAIQAGLALADQVIEEVTSLPIHYNVLLDFAAFKQAVDTVGGVAIDVPEDLYDPTMAWENGNNPLLAKAGYQSFNAKQALNYVRSRQTSNDFARGERQRLALLALKEKVSNIGTFSNPLKIAGLLNAFGDNVSTDLSLGDANRLYKLTKTIPNSSVTSLSLADKDKGYVTTGPMNGQSIVLPKAGLFNYSEIQTYIRSQIKDGYILKENASILVLNGTTKEGFAGTEANKLKSYGYNVVGAGNAPTKGYTGTVVVDMTGGASKYTKNYLERRFSTTAVAALPDATIQTQGANFVIILGSDATSSSQN